jgi:hypothetical protein
VTTEESHEASFILAHGFREFSEQLLPPLFLSLCEAWRKGVMEQRCSSYDSQEGEREREKARKKSIAFKAIPTVT